MSEIIVIDTDYIEKPTCNTDFDDIRRNIYGGKNKIKITIVVQAYGRIKKTKKCIETLLKYTNHIPFELILVDNGSVEPEVMEYYKTISYKNTKILRISKNITGVLAVNEVMKLIKTEYMVIVNNDIVLTPNWLKNILICVESDKNIGMVCPVSTNISNGQWEDLGGFSTEEEMEKKAAIFNRSDPLKWEERIRLIPTVVLYRREIFDRVGSYDISFVHDFGDDDYSFRIRRAGYKLILCKDVFVHHDHNVFISEDKNVEEANMVSEKGRLYFQKKYNGIDAWTDTNNTIATYLEKLEKPKSTGKNKVLVIEPRCGAPVLDVYNYYRKFGIKEVSCEAFITNAKYYLDLEQCCDEVVVNQIDQIATYYEKYQFDMVVIGDPINQLNYPEKIIESIYGLTKIGGQVLFAVKNVLDYKSFLYMLDVRGLQEETKYYNLFYEDVYQKINALGAEKVQLWIQKVVIQKELEKQIQEIYQKMIDDVDCFEQVNKLFIDKYWFMVEK